MLKMHQVMLYNNNFSKLERSHQAYEIQRERKGGGNKLGQQNPHSTSLDSMQWLKKRKMWILLLQETEMQLAVSRGCSLASQLSCPLCIMRIMSRKHGVLLGFAVSELCLHSSPCFCTVAPFPATPTQTCSGSFLFLIQSLCKQCHNLSGAEHDICLMEMLALL